MISLTELTAFLRNSFQPFYTKDVSQNGLQIAAPEEIHKIAFAVDACQAVFDECARQGADFLFVHHGLFWRDIEMVVETHYQRLKTMIENNIGLYAMHLPLDAHTQLGNNRQLAEILEADDLEFFAQDGDVLLGCKAVFSQARPRDQLLEQINQRLNTEALMLPFGPEKVERLGIVSGGGGKYITDAITEGCDTFLTGEPEHVVYHVAREYQVNFIAAGHYATETVGVKAVQKAIEAEYDVETVFIDHPTGM